MRKLKERGAVGWAVAVIILLCIIGFLIWWFGFNTNNNTTTTTTTNHPATVSDAQKKATITSNWTKFFSGQTPADQKEALLQNGSQYTQTLDAQSQTPTAKATTATVSKVDLNGDGTATVTYTINVNGQPQLKDQTGQSVQESGVWKVSDAAFCSLLQLSGAAPANCPGTNNSGGSQTQTQGQSQTGTQAPSATSPATP